MGTSGWEKFRTRRRKLRAVSAKEVAHMDQANLAAVRLLIPPTTRSCCLAPSVTTSLYSTTVSQALRQTLRASFSERRSAELLKIISYEAKLCMLVSLK